MRRRVWGTIATVASGAGLAVSLGACSLLIATDGLSEGGDAAQPDPPDAAMSDAISEASGAESGLNGATPDATPCKSGEKKFPLLGFGANPPGAEGMVCGPGNVLADDGLVAGLDRKLNGVGFIDGEDAVSCVGADFGDGAALSMVIVRMSPAGSACGEWDCVVGPDGCGTGHIVTLFAGPTMGSLLKLVPDVDLTSNALADYVRSTSNARFVVVCRQSWSRDRDDVVVDSIATMCP